jgi:1,4-alpha-glucan branching enzyme
MIKKEAVKKTNQVKLSFVLPADSTRPRISVVGDFNQWDPDAHPMAKRNNGTVSASVLLDPGQRVRFRYYIPPGEWFNDETADAYEPGDFGAANCVVIV